MRFKPSTIKDIALALNLSTSTVSRAMRDSYEISAETKKLVLDYAKKINYTANPIARSLKERRSYSIGIIVSEIANNFYSQVINGVESIAHNKNYQVVISQTHESAEREKMNVEYLSSRSVDGLLISLSSETNNIEYLKTLHNQGYPIVFFDRIPEDFDTFKVTSNNFKGAFDATEHLILNGHRRIAHLTNSKSLSITKERLAGYQGALKKHHIAYDENLVKFSEYGGMHMQEIDEAIDALFQQKFDAIFISGDKLSTGYLMYSKKKYPKLISKIAIAGFTNSNVVSIFSPSLTVVRQPAFEMGKVATDLLIRMIEAKRPITEYETITLETELIDEKDLKL
ncbi:LacI family transcriptional regulator [Sphingobacterium faecium NBRC 15299]|jgi:LacI family transcriptional regulator|uniref:LacI family DNA-binding transcriptional regulator n=1 Tax=Sphingobacterium faecium TaxID=34087 RepID=UPI000D38D579|nr:LacI family DNA-binding transcriptional regulator [Sphingobacterium faecium]PTX11001.1 LacI family transcriptional regulator [Sphingobacterium faecium]GEM62872.1 LacI family transcriptional regulator [Sphingobacterium faecium NBRC 15299]